MGQVSRGEWRWVTVFIIVALFLLLLPYALAASQEGTQWKFSGFLIGVEDGNSYIAKMQQGSEGAWLYRLAYTTEPQHGALIYLPYLLLGKLASPAARHLQLVILFHLARLAAAAGMIFVTYRFLATFVEDVWLRRLGLLLATLGGGLGWVQLASGSMNSWTSMPLEFYSPESFGFLEAFTAPHLAAARALLLLSLVFFLQGSLSSDPLGGWKAGAALLGAWLFQPLTVPIAWVVMAAYVVLTAIASHTGRIRRRATPGSSEVLVRPSHTQRALGQAVRAVSLSFLPVAYSAVTFNLDPILRQWTAQNLLPSPPITEYLISYSLLLLLAIAGICAVVRHRQASGVLLIGWLVAFPALVYFPINLQRRLADGFFCALLALALGGYEFLERRLPRWGPGLFRVLLVTLCLPSTVLMYVGSIHEALQPAPPQFLPAAEVGIFDWLNHNADPRSVVLCSFDTGNALPAYTDLTPYIGLGPETLHLQDKQKSVNAFFDPGSADSARQEILNTTRAGWIILGPSGSLPLLEDDIAHLSGVTLRIQASGWEVYQVKAPADP
ncbi:MAG: hypothetical protein ABSG98_08855 [Anaerolineales bacterium]|jgi:hypothetical protein